MKTKELVSYLIDNSDTENLFVSMPLLGWNFGIDNMAELALAVTKLINPTTIIIRQFTKIDSPVPFKNDPSRFLPMKRVIAGTIDGEEINFLSVVKTRESFETCCETGAKLPPVKDHSYVEPRTLLGKP